MTLIIWKTVSLKFAFISTVLHRATSIVYIQHPVTIIFTGLLCCISVHMVTNTSSVGGKVLRGGHVICIILLLRHLTQSVLRLGARLCETAARAAAALVITIITILITAAAAAITVAVTVTVRLPRVLALLPVPVHLGGAVREPRAARPAPLPPVLPLQPLRDVDQLQLPVLLLQRQQVLLQLLQVDHGVDLAEHVYQLLLSLLQGGNLLDDPGPVPAVDLLLVGGLVHGLEIFIKVCVHEAFIIRTLPNTSNLQLEISVLELVALISYTFNVIFAGVMTAV